MILQVTERTCVCVQIFQEDVCHSLNFLNGDVCTIKFFKKLTDAINQRRKVNKESEDTFVELFHTCTHTHTRHVIKK